jgi:sugar/nucleoside kinase (ribokinase family)
VSAVRVVVIGDVMLDVVARPRAPIAPTSDTPAAVRVGRGGSGSNIAVALTRAGADVTYVGAAGRDAAGAVVAAELGVGGVRPRLMSVDGPTGVVVALVAPDGQRAMMTDRGVNPLLSREHVVGALAAAFDHLHVSGYTLLDEHTRAVGAFALALAVERGASTSVDVCSVAPLRALGPAAFLEAAGSAATLFANEEEALALTGADGLEGALEWLAGRFAEVVVTRGPAGARARRGREEVAIEAQSDHVVDTTGAGDAATGAYLGARLSGHSMQESLSAAMAASAIVVHGLGAGYSR